jgi:hypothetical protein
MSTSPSPSTGDDATIAAPVHVYVLIDMSGSMESIRGDVIGGFNTLLATQRAEAEDGSRATVVLFDSVEPNHVVCSGVPVREVVDLDERTYEPRGGTPLLDATGVLIQRADREATERAAAGLPAEDILFVTITDGAENQSREYRRDDILAMVEERRARGWDFVFLSADLDAFDDAERMGYAASDMAAWDKSSAGASHSMLMTHDAIASKKRSIRERKGSERRRTEGDAGGREG